jgi:5-oxoprolinase (ATP-hydrolysing) subunit A
MDINCDLGEGERLEKTRRLLQCVTSANIACGGHAGSERSMRSCLRLCAEFKVNAGAHPGFPDRRHFGRSEMPISPSQLELLLGHQTGALVRLAAEEKVPITHLKLHGALYHVVERDPRLSKVYARFVRENFSQMRIIGLPNGSVVCSAHGLGIDVWGEIFSDREYGPEGDLVPRSRPGAIIEDLALIRKRMGTFLLTGRLPLSNGRTRKIAARTICVHADSPGSPRIARMLARLCVSAGRSGRM